MLDWIWHTVADDNQLHLPACLACKSFVNSYATKAKRPKKTDEYVEGENLRKKMTQRAKNDMGKIRAGQLLK